MNNELNKDAGWDLFYKSVVRRSDSYLENIGIVYLDKNTFIVQNTSNQAGHNAVMDRLYESICILWQ